MAIGRIVVRKKQRTKLSGLIKELYTSSIYFWQLVNLIAQYNSLPVLRPNSFFIDQVKQRFPVFYIRHPFYGAGPVTTSFVYESIARITTERKIV